MGSNKSFSGDKENAADVVRNHAKYNSTPLDNIYNLCLPQITHTYGCRLQLELLRMGAITPETCRTKYREE
jgi:hypothetical protein